MDLRVISDDGDVLRLGIAGRILRSDTVPSLQPLDDLLGADGYARQISLDMAETTFIDTRCLGWLLTIHKRFQEAGGKLVIHSIRPHVVDILKMMNFDQILSIAGDEAAALELLQRNDP